MKTTTTRGASGLHPTASGRATSDERYQSDTRSQTGTCMRSGTRPPNTVAFAEPTASVPHRTFTSLHRRGPARLRLRTHISSTVLSHSWG